MHEARLKRFDKPSPTKFSSPSSPTPSVRKIAWRPRNRSLPTIPPLRSRKRIAVSPKNSPKAMSKRPNLKEIRLKIVKGEGGLHADHPVHHLSANEGFLFLPISLLSPDPDQPRQDFDNASLADLTASVKEQGVLQPILARKNPSGE